MKKRGKSGFIKSICSFEIFLFISLSFSVAFILNGGLVSGQEFDYVKWSQKVADITSKAPPTEAARRGPTELVTDLFKGKAFGTPPELAKGATTQFTGTGLANTLLGAVAWAGLAYGIVQVLGNLFGFDEGLTNALSYGAATFAGTYAGLDFAVQNLLIKETSYLAQYAFPTALVLGVVVFVLTYKKEKKKLVTFECKPFEPPLGGAKCEECNKDIFRPCSEYRCKALGQACELLNPGTLEEKCAWVNPKDVTSPTIEPWKDVLRPRDLNYVPDNTIRPPNRGVKVVAPGVEGCLQAFTPFEFGITTNEPAQCKIDYNHTAKFDDMQFYLGGLNYYRYNHTQKMKLPGPDNSPEGDLAPELENDGFFSLFARCRDANGNENVDEFVFNFCVDPSEDTTPPRIEGTSIISESPIRHDAESIPIEVYVNEPAECKWSRQSKNYNDMENKMESCATETFQINADLNYVCKGNLTITDKGKDNKFFFRCKDNPGKEESKRNVMVQSYELILKGSQPLDILNVGPNGTIFSSTDTAKVDLNVRTGDGAEEGKSICYFSNTGESNSYIAMFETNSFEHKQSLDLISGNYEYFFRCIDRGGNTDEDKAEFNVFIDKEAPVVTRAYKEDGLKVVTDEDAECVYSLNSCDYEFDDAISNRLVFIYSNPSLKKQHFIEWKANSAYYIKCRDFYDNKPSPNECSIVVKSVELETRGGK